MAEFELPVPGSGAGALQTVASLREIAQALSAAWDLDTTLDLITRRTTQVMLVDSCSIYLLEADGETLRLRASTGLARKALGRVALKMGEGLTGWAAQQNTPVAVRDAQADPRFKLLPETREIGFHSLLAVPLVNRERVIGAMNVQTAAFHNFAGDEVQLLSLIGDLAAGALDRAILYDNMNRQIAELTTLAKVSETVTSPLYLDEMLDLVVEMAARVMDAAVCSLQLIDQERGELIMKSARSPSQAYRARPALKIGEGIAGLVIRDRKPVTVADVRTDPRYHLSRMARQEGMVSMLSVPLMVHERVIGVLNCYTERPHQFSPEQIALFSTFANQTALAIENARLVTNAAVVREMHHRIKNNLQTVAMLLRLQAGDGQSLTARDALHLSISRIQSIAAVHEVLAQEGFRSVNVKEVAERIARLTAQNMLRPDLEVEIAVEGEAIILPSQAATSLALVINELLQNSLEHAFAGLDRGSVRISMGRGPGEFVVEVCDDGVGLGAARPASLGLEIVETLVREDLRGKLEFSADAVGTRVVIRLPRSVER